MSVRGPRGGRGRGRGIGTGRGRGRGGKSTTWEWHNNYSPDPEIYNQLWHIRQEPVTVTPFLPTECPLPNAQSRIVDRRQTEGDIQRNFYVVEVTNFTNRETSVSSVGDAGSNITEIFHVDLSRILDYVSPEELERFENEQFQAEAEAEAVAMRMEAEELKRRRLEKNARSTAIGQNSRMLGGLNLDRDMRPGGRPRGRGRGRGRGSRRGRAALISNSREEEMQEEVVHAEEEEIHQTEDGPRMTIDETDSEDGNLAADLQAQASPKLARSAFVANSALPLSPVLSHRRPSGAPTQGNIINASEDDEESDPELLERDARSMSSAAMQLRIEDDIRGRSGNTPEDDDDDGDNGHRSKRRRTESTASNHRRSHVQASLPERPHSPFSKSILDSPVPAEDSDDAIPAHKAIVVDHSLRNGDSHGTELDNIHVQLPQLRASIEGQSEDGEEEDAEEYVVEAIIEHYREAGKKYYLVKWQGYEDSHDWLPEEDLEGAAELVAEYKEKVRRKKLKGNQKKTK